MFPESSSDCLALADDLVAFLGQNLDETRTRLDWTAQVFRVLDHFAKERGWDAFHRWGEENRHEFLWDWTAFEGNAGLVIACESEWNLDLKNDRRDPKHDFEKLLSAACPVKLFIFWGHEEAAGSAVKDLVAYGEAHYSRFQPGSVFIFYCIDPQTKLTKSKDYVWQVQVPGEFKMSQELPSKRIR